MIIISSQKAVLFAKSKYHRSEDSFRESSLVKKRSEKVQNELYKGNNNERRIKRNHHHIPWLFPPRGIAVIKEEKLWGSNSKKLYASPLSLSDDSQELLQGRGFLVPSPRKIRNQEEITQRNF